MYMISFFKTQKISQIYNRAHFNRYGLNEEDYSKIHLFLSEEIQNKTKNCQHGEAIQTPAITRGVLTHPARVVHSMESYALQAVGSERERNKMLFVAAWHDVGKPASRFADEKKKVWFRGHAGRSIDGKQTQDYDVLVVIAYHDNLLRDGFSNDENRVRQWESRPVSNPFFARLIYALNMYDDAGWISERRHVIHPEYRQIIQNINTTPQANSVHYDKFYQAIERRSSVVVINTGISGSGKSTEIKGQVSFFGEENVYVHRFDRFIEEVVAEKGSVTKTCLIKSIHL